MLGADELRAMSEFNDSGLISDWWDSMDLSKISQPVRVCKDNLTDNDGHVQWGVLNRPRSGWAIASMLGDSISLRDLGPSTDTFPVQLDDDTIVGITQHGCYKKTQIRLVEAGLRQVLELDKAADPEKEGRHVVNCIGYADCRNQQSVSAHVTEVHEWMDIGTLRDVMVAWEQVNVADKHGLPERVAAAIGFQLLQAVANSERNDVDKLNITPSSILFRSDGRVKVYRQPYSPPSLDAPCHIHGDYMMNSIEFLSPEEVNCNSEVGPATNVFRVGMALCNMLGANTSRCSNFAVHLAQRSSGTKPEVRSGLSAPCLRLLERCMQRLPERRHDAKRLARHSSWFRANGVSCSADAEAIVEDFLFSHFKHTCEAVASARVAVRHRVFLELWRGNKQPDTVARKRVHRRCHSTKPARVRSKKDTEASAGAGAGARGERDVSCHIATHRMVSSEPPVLPSHMREQLARQETKEGNPAVTPTHEERPRLSLEDPLATPTAPTADISSLPRPGRPSRRRMRPRTRRPSLFLDLDSRGGLRDEAPNTGGPRTADWVSRAAAARAPIASPHNPFSHRNQEDWQAGQWTHTAFSPPTPSDAPSCAADAQYEELPVDGYVVLDELDLKPAGHRRMPVRSERLRRAATEHISTRAGAGSGAGSGAGAGSAVRPHTPEPAARGGVVTRGSSAASDRPARARARKPTHRRKRSASYGDVAAVAAAAAMDELTPLPQLAQRPVRRIVSENDVLARTKGSCSSSAFAPVALPALCPRSSSVRRATVGAADIPAAPTVAATATKPAGAAQPDSSTNTPVSHESHITSDQKLRRDIVRNATQVGGALIMSLIM